MPVTRAMVESVMLVGLLAALLACGSKSDRCTATLDYQGKQSQANDVDEIAAKHSACRAWCKAHDPGVTSGPEKERNHALVGCASQCGGDVMFGQGSASVSCR